MLRIELAQLGSLSVAAVDGGLEVLGADLSTLVRPTEWPPAALAATGGRATAMDLALLGQQGVVQAIENGLLIATEDVVAAMVEGVGLPKRFTAPSPYLLQVDRDGDLPRATFAYQYRWMHGAQQVGIRRAGVHVRHEATHRVFHLDPRTVALVEAMDGFNSTPPSLRTPAAAWGAFARVRTEAEAAGAQLDGYLASNTVVIPSQISAEVRDHPDGSISFVPRCPELPGDEFADEFLKSSRAQAAYSIARPDGDRVRVIVEPRHQAVLERMAQVRRATGDARRRALAEPEEVFDGLIDDVEIAFGDRVLGIGEFQFSPQPSSPASGGFMQSLVGERDSAGAAAEPSSLETAVDAGDALVGGRGEPEPKSLPASIDLPRADGSGDSTVRFEDGAQLQDFRDAAAVAHSSGEDNVQWHGESLRVDPAALEALGGIGISGRGPTRGRDGRLYLIIYDNDETVRDVDVGRAAAARANPEPLQAPRMPIALRPDVQLKPHQIDGVRWLETCQSVPGRSGVLLADDMGLGKTLQVLVHLANVIESGRLASAEGQGARPPWRPILIVAPLILVENDTWTTEMASRFTNGGAVFQPVLKLYGAGIHQVTAADSARDALGSARLDAQKLMQYRVVITTYETLVNYQHSLARHVDGRPMWSVVVSDEAQRAKSMRTKISVALKAVSPQFHIAATGTPVENRLLDLWNLIDTVQSGLLGTARDFTKTYEAPLSESAESQRTSLDALRSELLFGAPHAFLIRRSKSQLADLPAKNERVVDCAMSSDEAERHAVLVSALSRPGVGKQTLGLLQELARLSQHPWLGDEALLGKDPAALCAASSKLRETMRVIDAIAARGEKVILFARLIDAQQLLARVISDRYTVPVDIVNGETKRSGSGDVRKQVLDRFRRASGFGAIVLSPFVAGVGLTITEANHVIHYGRWWNPAVEDQATDRAYRIGQTRPVTVYYPVLRDPTGKLPHGTFDEALHALVIRKRDVARDFLHPATADDARDAADMRETLVGNAATGASNAERGGDEGLQQGIDVSALAERELAALVAVIERRAGREVVLLPGEGYAGVHVLAMDQNGAKAVVVTAKSAVTEAILTNAEAGAVAMNRKQTRSWRPLIATGASVDASLRAAARVAGIEVLEGPQLRADARAGGITQSDIAIELAMAPTTLAEALHLIAANHVA